MCAWLQLLKSFFLIVLLHFFFLFFCCHTFNDCLHLFSFRHWFFFKFLIWDFLQSCSLGWYVIGHIMSFALQLAKINEEQKSKIRKTERALKIAEVSDYHVPYKLISCLKPDDGDSYMRFFFLYISGRTVKNKIRGHFKGQRADGGNELMDLLVVSSIFYVLSSNILFRRDFIFEMLKFLDSFLSAVKVEI